MNKRYVYGDEWYPVLRLGREDEEHSCERGFSEFTDEELADIVRVQREFYAWQVEIDARRGGECGIFWDHEIEETTQPEKEP